MGKRKKRAPLQAPEESTATTALGSLFADAGFTATEQPTAPDEPLVPSEGFDLANVPKAVLRMERKGRGGKTVTVIAQLPGEQSALEQVARDLRRALGCGARVEGAEVVVQGDVRERVRAWLAERGVRRVVG